VTGAPATTFPHDVPEHRAEEWIPVFRKSDAKTKSYSKASGSISRGLL
jgi:hypothetical protein